MTPTAGTSMKTLQSIFIIPVRHYLWFLGRLMKNTAVYHHSIRQNLTELVSVYEIFLTVSVSVSLILFISIEYFTFLHENIYLAAAIPLLMTAATTAVLATGRHTDLPSSVYSVHYLFLFFCSYYYPEIPGVMDETRDTHAWYLIELTVIFSQGLRPGKFPGLPVILVVFLHSVLFKPIAAAGITDLFHLLLFIWVSVIVLFTESILYFTTINYLELKYQKLQQQEELILAQRVYNNLFPVFTGNEFLNMHVYRHAENQTGGDLYDVIQLREGNLGFFLADVSGHGISSAIMSAALKAIIYRMPYNSRLDPESFLTYLDKSMSEEYGSHHASAVYLFFDFTHYMARISNAGHPPVLYSKKGGPFQEIAGHGTLIGLGLNQKHIPQNTILFHSGDRFLIYTDGLLEYETHSGDVADAADLLEKACTDAGDLQGDSLVKHVLHYITSRRDFYRFRDDVLMVLLEIK